MKKKKKLRTVGVGVGTLTRFLLKVFFKMKQKFAEKKIQGNVFLLNQRPHAKFQLI